MPSRPFALLLVLVVQLLAPTAEASDPVAAEELFRLGVDAAGRGDHRTACEKFEESQRLDPAPGTLMRLGECKTKLGRIASAWQHYRQAYDLLAGDERRPLAEQAAAALEPRLSRLEIHLAADAPSDTVVLRDGVALERPSLGVPLPVDAGEHVVAVKAPGHDRAEYRVALAEAERQRVDVRPGSRQTGPRTADVATPSQGSGGLLTGGVVLGSIGLLALGAGIVTGSMTIDRKETVDSHCADGLCDPIGFDAAAEGKTLSAVSTAGFVIGLVGIGLGITLVAIELAPASDSPGAQASRRATPGSPAAVTAPLRLTVELQGHLGAATMGVRGRFLP